MGNTRARGITESVDHDPPQMNPAPEPEPPIEAFDHAAEAAAEAAGAPPHATGLMGSPLGDATVTYPTVIQALAHAGSLVGAVAKGDENKEQKYAYRGMERIMAQAGPALHRAGVVVVPTIERSDVGEMARGANRTMWRLVTLTVRYRFYGPAGDHVDALVVGEGLDNADKAHSKAMTMAWKVALVQVLAIGAGDHDDPDATTPPPQEAPSARQGRQNERGRGDARPAAQGAGGDKAAPPRETREEALARIAAEDEPRAEAITDLLDLLDTVPEADARRAQAKQRFVRQWGSPMELTCDEACEAITWVYTDLSEYLPTPAADEDARPEPDDATAGTEQSEG